MLGPISPVILSRPPLTASVTTDKRGPVAAQGAPAQQFMAVQRADLPGPSADRTEAGPVTVMESRA